MDDEEREFIKKINIDKAKIKIKDCTILTIISMLMYIYPFIYGEFDFGIIFELATIIFSIIALKFLSDYNEELSKIFIVLAIIPMGWLIIYDILVIIAYSNGVFNYISSIYCFFYEKWILVVDLVVMLSTNRDFRKADDPETYKESTDWFYERLEKKEKREN